MASQITSLPIVCSTVFSRHRSKKTSKLRVTGFCDGNSTVTGEFPAQRANNAEKVFIWWRQHLLLHTVVYPIKETRGSSVQQPWSSLGTLKFAFNVSSDNQDTYLAVFPFDGFIKPVLYWIYNTKSKGILYVHGTDHHSQASLPFVWSFLCSSHVQFRFET